MYVRLCWAVLASAKLVDTKSINSLKLLGSLPVDHSKSIVKAICRPDKNAGWNDVSKTAEHHLIVGCFICKYWRRCLRECNMIADQVTTGNLFEDTERQMELEKNWGNV